LKINILGTRYTVYHRSDTQDAYLRKCDGYCDRTTRIIVIKTKSDNCEIGDFERYRRKVLRHEIVHAFLFESGLAENFVHPEWRHEETMVDWIAAQFPKMLKAFEEAGCVED